MSTDSADDIDIPSINFQDWLKNENKLYNSLKYAAFLQQGILPKQRHFDRIFGESFILYLPMQIVSGDFYWLAEVDDLVYLAVGDCMGHGVPGAMLSVLVSNLLDYAVLNKRIKKTNKILKEIDKRFTESFTSIDQDQTFNNDWVDMSLCCIDRKRKQIFFSGAHNKVMLASKNNFEVFKGSFNPIGSWQIHNDIRYDTTSICYKPNNILYLSTDGFSDQVGGVNSLKYQTPYLQKFIHSISLQPLAKQKSELEKEFFSWKGEGSQSDDVCIIGVKL
ncbi:MAG: PP2C family protein-serine/threonine phosphatase [Bacteroidales bacterium]